VTLRGGVLQEKKKRQGQISKSGKGTGEAMSYGSKTPVGGAHPSQGEDVGTKLAEKGRKKRSKAIPRSYG